MAITQESIDSGGLGKPSTMEHLALLVQARWDEIKDHHAWVAERVWDGSSLSDYDAKAGAGATVWVNTETGEIDILDYKTTGWGQRDFWIDENGVAWKSIGHCYSISFREFPSMIGSFIEKFIIRTRNDRDREIFTYRNILDRTTPSAITAEEWLSILEEKSKAKYESGGEILDLVGSYGAPLFREQFKPGSVNAKRIRKIIEETFFLKMGPLYHGELYLAPRNMRRVLKMAYGNLSDKELVLEISGGNAAIEDSFAEAVDTYLYLAVNSARDRFIHPIRDTSMPDLIEAAAKHAPRLLSRSVLFAAYSGQIQIMKRNSNFIGLGRRLFGIPRSKKQFLNSTIYIHGSMRGEQIVHYLNEHPQIKKLSKVLPSRNHVSPVRNVTYWKLTPGYLSEVSEDEEYKLYLASEAFESWVSRL